MVITTINPSYCSYVHQLSYLGGPTLYVFWLSRSIIIFIIASPPSTNDNRNRFPKWMCFCFGNCLAAAVICPDQGHVVPPLCRAEDLSEESYKTHLKRLGSFLGASWSPKRLQETIARWDLKLGAWLGAASLGLMHYAQDSSLIWLWGSNTCVFSIIVGIWLVEIASLGGMG